MFTKKTPDAIKGSLRISALGEENTLDLTFHNRTQADIEEFAKDPANSKLPDSATTTEDFIRHNNIKLVLFVVKSFDDGTEEAFPLTYKGMEELEMLWPGVLFCIIQGFYNSRVAALEKN